MKLRLIIPTLAAALLVSVAADAATGYTTGRLNLRAGPGRDYPTIEVLRRDTRVTVFGCLDRFDWCDVQRGRQRGWVDGDSLVIPYQGRRVGIIEYGPRLRLPMLTFSFDNYWDTYYRRAGFYRDRDSWRERWRGWSNRVDQDHDGIPNRIDRDRDNDGVPNRRDDAPNNPRRN